MSALWMLRNLSSSAMAVVLNTSQNCSFLFCLGMLVVMLQLKDAPLENDMGKTLVTHWGACWSKQLSKRCSLADVWFRMLRIYSNLLKIIWRWMHFVVICPKIAVRLVVTSCLRTLTSPWRTPPIWNQSLALGKSIASFPQKMVFFSGICLVFVCIVSSLILTHVSTESM